MAASILSPATDRIAELLAEGEASGLLSQELVDKLKSIDTARQAEAARRQPQQDKRAAECAYHAARIKHDGYTVVRHTRAFACPPIVHRQE